MKVLWWSNAPWVGSGYGVQTDLFLSKLAEDGHEVHLVPNYGLEGGGAMKTSGYTVHSNYQTGSQANSEVLLHYNEKLKPDLIIALADAWVISDQVITDTPMALYAPIDHVTVPPMVGKKLAQAKWTLAMSQDGARAMREIGLNPMYTPHAYDATTYRTGDIMAARASWGFDPDVFLVAMVAANKGFPDRKRFREAFAAFSQLDMDNVVLYVHAVADPRYSGLNLMELAQFYGIEQKVLFPEVNGLVAGAYKPTQMADLYRAADVLLAPSAGEGFGVPVVEAQACGCPVIVTDATAQAELCGAGWRVELTDDDWEYTLQGALQARPPVSAIREALVDAYYNAHLLRDGAAKWAKRYDVNYVWETYWRPALKKIESDLGNGQLDLFIQAVK